MGRQPTRDGSLIRQREIALNEFFSNLLYHIGLHVALGNIEPLPIDREQTTLNFAFDDGDDEEITPLSKKQIEYAGNAAKRRAFSQNLKRIREENGYSRRYMLKLLELRQSTYSCYETGKSFPSEPRFQKIAEILKVQPEDLLKEVKK